MSFFPSQLEAERRRNGRLRKQVKTLRKQNQQNVEKLENTEQYRLPKSNPAKDIVRQILRHEDLKGVPKYSSQIIQFALTMQHYGTKGYSFLRKVFHVHHKAQLFVLFVPSINFMNFRQSVGFKT